MASLPDRYRCLLLRRDRGTLSASVESVPSRANPNDGAVSVKVLYSAINYKDALAVAGRGKIIRGEYPFVPGIDLVASVVDGGDSLFHEGEMVIGTGWGLGETWWGGYSEYQKLRPEWLVRLPEGMDPVTAATAGTAGLTAMLSAIAIESAGVRPSAGPVLVTGASGGVGSLSVLFLSSLGYAVVASTGKPEAESYLRELGASEIQDRGALAAGASQPLDSARWAGAVDNVGGSTLEAILSGVGRHGVVASCGLVGGAEFSSTVFPFILRGVRLVGIDSNTCPVERRKEAWQRIGRMLSADRASQISRPVVLEDVAAACGDILAGRVRGRLIVPLEA